MLIIIWGWAYIPGTYSLLVTKMSRSLFEFAQDTFSWSRESYSLLLLQSIQHFKKNPQKSLESFWIFLHREWCDFRTPWMFLSNCRLGFCIEFLNLETWLILFLCLLSNQISSFVFNSLGSLFHLFLFLSSYTEKCIFCRKNDCISFRLSVFWILQNK